MCDHQHGDDGIPVHAGRGVTRRSVVAGVGALGAASLAGCLGNGGATPDAVSLAGELDCDNCGMIIEKHPGPNGQTFFQDQQPEGHENPSRYDSVKVCQFPYLFRMRQRGWKATAFYVTDYSTVDYTLSKEGEKTFISSHVEAESFTDGKEAYYVVGSNVYGAMGKDFVPFSVESDATAFAEEHGGDVLEFDDITPTIAGA